MAIMTKKEKQEAVIDTIKDKTKEWEQEVYTNTEKMTEKAKSLSKTLTDMSLSVEDKDRLASLFSTITGENVKIEKENDLEFETLTALVLTKITDKFKHTYEIGKVVISLGDGTAIDENGKVGSHIPPNRSILRPATKDEMDSFPEAQIKGLMKEVSIAFSSKK